jgi:hypothetical protein
MSGMALIFMIFFWAFIIVLVTYCLTLVFFEDIIKLGKAQKAKVEG